LALAAALSLGLVPDPARAADPEKLVFVFQKQKDPAQIKEHADQVAAFLSAELKMPVQAYVPTDYVATVQALASGKADVAYVSAIPFLLARRDAGATLLLAEQRADADGKLRTDYDSVFVVRQDSPIQSLSDVKAKARDLRLVFTSSTSTSGFVMATYRLVQEGILKPRQEAGEVFKSVNFGGSYTQALEQVLDGRGDLCAVSFYTLEGPSADVYLTKEKRQQLRIIARTPAVPTHLICARGGLSDGLRQRVKAALLKLGQEKSQLLADVYGARSFVEVDEKQHVQAAIDALGYLNVPMENFAK
jgi:phosphonate transport system substrate-binding protein